MSDEWRRKRAWAVVKPWLVSAGYPQEEYSVVRASDPHHLAYTVEAALREAEERGKAELIAWLRNPDADLLRRLVRQSTQSGTELSADSVCGLIADALEKSPRGGE